MSLITCSECRTSVSSAAKACPNCGASARVLRRGTGPMIGIKTKLFLGFVGLVMLAMAFQPREAPEAPPTPAEATKSRRDRQAFDAVVALKHALREPDSAVFDKIGANETGDVVCIVYRARNGFGGMNLDHVVFVDGTPSRKRGIWKRNCVHKPLYDTTGVARVAKWSGA